MSFGQSFNQLLRRFLMIVHNWIHFKIYGYPSRNMITEICLTNDLGSFSLNCVKAMSLYLDSNNEIVDIAVGMGVTRTRVRLLLCKAYRRHLDLISKPKLDNYPWDKSKWVKLP